MLHAVLRFRRWLVLAAVLLAFAGAALRGGRTAQAADQRRVGYTYDPSAPGPAPAIKEGFAALYPDAEVVFLAPGSAGETLARIIAELHAGGSDADVFIGISDT